MLRASQLTGRGPTDVDASPVPARNQKSNDVDGAFILIINSCLACWVKNLADSTLKYFSQKMVIDNSGN